MSSEKPVFIFGKAGRIGERKYVNKRNNFE